MIFWLACTFSNLWAAWHLHTGSFVDCGWAFCSGMTFAFAFTIWAEKP